MLGKRLKDLRGANTQQEVADKLGISRARYSHYENEHVQPDNELLQKMADLHEVSTDYLLGRTEMPKKVLSESSRILVDSLNLTDEEILNTIRFEIDGKEIKEEDMKEFIAYVRFKRSTNKE